MPHPLDETVARLSRQLYELMRVVTQRTTGHTLEILHEEGLTMPQMVALHHLAAVGPLTLGALGDALHLSTSATSSMVDRLVERGLLDRWEHPVDRRQRLVGVSPAGAALASRMAAARAEELQEGFARLDPELRARLADVFDEVIAQLRAGGDE